MQIGGESMPKVTVEMDMMTERLKAKLKEISTHAEALANELESIDNAEMCEGCGSFMYEEYIYDGNRMVDSLFFCPECEG